MVPDPDSIPEGFLKAADVLKRHGRAASSLKLLKHAFLAGPGLSVARAGYWAGLQYGDTAFSQTCLAYLEATPGPHHDGWLQGKRAGLMGLPPDPEDVAAWTRQTALANSCRPVPDRLCYLLHCSFPYVTNGYAARSHGMAGGLKSAGLDVVAITRPGFPADAKAVAAAPAGGEVELGGITYRALPAPNRRQMPGPDYARQAADRLTEVFAELRPAMVMAASNHITAVPAFVAARRLGLPFFYEVRGFWEITRGSADPDYLTSEDFRRLVALESYLADQADHVFTLAAPMKEELVRRGVPAERITLAPNACIPGPLRERDAELAAAYGIPEGVAVIGYVGAFAQYEGLDDLVRACVLLRKRGQAFRLLLVGGDTEADGAPGPVTSEIRKIAEEGGLGDWLIMPGRIPPDRVEAHYSLIDIAPFPRKPQPVSEMIPPLKPLEAMASETAVVASSVQALAELVQDGHTGLVFEKGNVADLASVLGALVSDPERRKDLARAARDWARAERTWASTAEIVVGQIRRCLGHDEGRNAESADGAPIFSTEREGR